MTDPHYEHDEYGDENPAAEPVTYSVYNPDQTIGVVCDREGGVVGVFIDDFVLDNGDTWVAREVLRVAKLAHMKSRVGLRAEMERNGTDAFTLRSFGLPTDDDYRAVEQAEFALNGQRNGHQGVNGHQVL